MMRPITELEFVATARRCDLTKVANDNYLSWQVRVEDAPHWVLKFMGLDAS